MTQTRLVLQTFSTELKRSLAFRDKHAIAIWVYHYGVHNVYIKMHCLALLTSAISCSPLQTRRWSSMTTQCW